MKILIVDDHAVVRHGVKHILEEWQPDICVSQAQDADEAMKCLTSKKWDLVILDVNLPGKSGVVLLGQIKEQCPALPVLVLSMYPEDQYALRMLKAGASGYMTKETAPEELVNAVKKITRGGRYISAALCDMLVSAQIEGLQNLHPHELLSDREYEVLCMIAAGKDLIEIGKILSLSRKTVWSYKKRLIEKMRMTTDSELVRYAIRHGLVR